MIVACIKPNSEQNPLAGPLNAYRDHNARHQLVAMYILTFDKLVADDLPEISSQLLALACLCVLSVLSSKFVFSDFDFPCQQFGEVSGIRFGSLVVHDEPGTFT